MNFCPNYLKGVVICHGKSEVQMCKFIKSNLRLHLEIASDKNGDKSIQIGTLMRFLNKSPYKTKKEFLKNFEDELDIENPLKNFKVFTIMDTDDCTIEQKKNYISGAMFKNHWLAPYIVPVFNSPELESVLIDSKVEYKKSKGKMEQYIKIFPTDPKYQKTDTMQVSEFQLKLEKSKKTNMDNFIKFCLDASN